MARVHGRDTAHLQRNTAPTVTLTLSSGRTFDRASMLRDAPTHRPAPSMVIEAKGSSVVHASATSSPATRAGA